MWTSGQGALLAKGKWAHRPHSGCLGQAGLSPSPSAPHSPTCRGWGTRYEATFCPLVVPARGPPLGETPISQELVETNPLPLREHRCPLRCPPWSPTLSSTTPTPTSREAGGVEEGIRLLFAKLSLDILSPSLATPPRLPGKCSGCYFIRDYWNRTVSCQLPLPPPALRSDGRWEMPGPWYHAVHMHCTHAHTPMHTHLCTHPCAHTGNHMRAGSPSIPPPPSLRPLIFLSTSSCLSV